ncbi:MAG: class I SAM-dependent methyltransferase [Thermotogota bacterium]
MSKKKKISFYLDTTVAGFEKAKLIIEDYTTWFKADNSTQLILFASANHPHGLISFLTKSKLIDRYGITFLEKPIAPDKLYRFYTKKMLLNEWVQYKKHDIFRLYKLFYPLNRETGFDNQPISIQYDVRYHEHRSDNYKSYSHTQTAHIASALDFYKPKRIIDAGCGAGAQYYCLLDQIRKLNIQYVGIDMSRFQIIKALDLFSAEQTNFLLGDVTELDFEDNAFDLGFTESTLMFCSDPIKALKEINRVCKEGFFGSLYTI